MQTLVGFFIYIRKKTARDLAVFNVTLTVRLASIITNTFLLQDRNTEFTYAIFN